MWVWTLTLILTDCVTWGINLSLLQLLTCKVGMLLSLPQEIGTRIKWANVYTDNSTWHIVNKHYLRVRFGNCSCIVNIIAIPWHTVVCLAHSRYSINFCSVNEFKKWIINGANERRKKWFKISHMPYWEVNTIYFESCCAHLSHWFMALAVITLEELFQNSLMTMVVTWQPNSWWSYFHIEAFSDA